MFCYTDDTCRAGNAALQVSTFNRQHTLYSPPEGQEGMQFNDIFPAAKLSDLPTGSFTKIGRTMPG
jgi:hypothetical protein